jgi:hypothetical protein
MFYVLSTSAQDTAKIRDINRLVSSINAGNFTIRIDSSNQDFPNLGHILKSYLTTVLDGNNLKKYINYVVSLTKKDSVLNGMTISTSFYFNNNKLIKVEEFGIQADKRQSFEWYYDNDKPIFWTSQNEKAPSRAELLLTISNEILKKVSNGN